MAGGPSTPGLAAAVTNTGGLGFLAGGYKSPDQIGREIRATRTLTDGPIGVNLFVMSANDADEEELEAYRRELQVEADRHGVELGTPRWDDDAWEAKLDVVRAERPDVVSFTFGCPAAGILRELDGLGILTTVTVTDAAEARAAACNGAQVLVGTALLLADEAGTAPAYRTALQDPQFTGTAVTRAFTGRPARSLRNRFIDDHPITAHAYPQIHYLAAPLRAAAAARNDAQALHLWAGTGYRHTRGGSAAEIVAALTP